MAPAAFENFLSIEQLVEMTLGTDRGTWWADPNFGSDLWKLRQYGKVGPLTASEVKRAIDDALRWLIEDGLAKSINVSTELTSRTSIAYAVTVVRPDDTAAIIKDVWHGI